MSVNTIPRVARAWLRWAPPLLLVLACFDLFVVVAASASYAPLGRDQGIFHYTAFATSQGERLYRDIREVNGPLTHLLHRLFLLLGGADVHRFRSLDLSCSFGLYAVLGAAAPRLTETRSSRLAYALLGVLLLGGQYLGYLGWDQAQRESFATWFVLAALVLAVWPRAGARAYAAVGLLGAVACFGKPTMGAFVPLCLLGAFAHGPGAARRLLALIGGALAGALLTLAATWLWLGDPWRGLQLYLIEAPALYAELFRRGTFEILGLPWLRVPLLFGAVTGGVAIVAIAVSWWPKRLLPLALAPWAGIAAMLVQGKGYLYHAHPVTGTAWLIVVLGLCTLHERALRHLGLACALAAVTLLLVVQQRRALGSAPAYFSRDVAWAARAGAAERSEERLARAEMHDFHPYAMAQAAAWLQAHTRRDDRVQIYGIDPLVLFWAERLCATPYLYEYDWNVGHALRGATERRGATDAKTLAIVDMGRRHGADALERLQKAPPAAFVLFDGSPFMTERAALDDLSLAQPAIAAFLQQHYRLAVTFADQVHVWERLP